MSGLLSHRMLVVVLIGVLAAAGDACAQDTWYVDDDAAGDPGAGDPTVSDPNEDGSADHPFDAIQEGIDAAVVDGDTVLVLDGEYTGVGNYNLDFGGRLITVRSANGAASCVIDCQGLGRGFYFHNDETAAAVVEGLTITNASTATHGGGMYISRSSPTVTQCTFSGNDGHFGGGMCNDTSSATVTHCTFSGNTAGGWGGGMENYHSRATVTHCTFSGNTSANFGGGMYNTASSPTVTHCTFSGNTAAKLGGGMCNEDLSNSTVTQCTFSGNTTDDYGGAMYNYQSSPTVTQCTFSGNTADDQGGAMVNDNQSSPTVTNCILWNDTPDEIFNEDFNSVPTVTYSDVQGGYAGTGNIDDDPVFVDAAGGNLRLSAGSPCIDAGDNVAVPPGLTTDLDGKPRISHGTVDMGAYERQDDDGDGVIDGSDVCPGFDDNADADSDGVPDGCDDCPGTPSCATNIDADGCAIDSDGDGVVDGCSVTPQVLDDDGDGVPNDQDACPNTPEGTTVDASGCPTGCCGASGPVAPLGLAIGMLLLSRFTGYRSTRRDR